MATVSSDGVRFPVAAVRQHADTLDHVAAAVGQAGSAVRQVTMDAGAYGQLCHFLPTLFGPLFGLAIDALQGATDALQETATNLREGAHATEATDQASGRRVAAAAGPTRPRLELPL